jgi:hypothetical protein
MNVFALCAVRGLDGFHERERRMRIAFLLIVLVLTSATVAAAETSSRTSTRQRGTHFLAEVGVGGAFGTGFTETSAGFGFRATLGVGGAFRGFPPRFYLVGAFRYSTLTATVEKGNLSSVIDRRFVDLSAGLRVLFPWDRFRILTELTFGKAMSSSSALVNGMDRFETEDDRLAFYVATGLQYRLHQHLSLGLIAEWSLPLSRPPDDFLVEVSRLADDGGMRGWTSLLVQVVAHF